MAHFEKHFTVEEANELLPEVREILLSVRTLRDHLIMDWDAAVPVVQAVPLNGGGVEANPYLTDLQAINRRIRRLVEMGIQLKDVDRGLVDFPAWRDDDEVLLCWHLGEDEVRYWHDLESGFSGRQPI